MISAIGSVITDRQEYSRYYRNGPSGNYALINITVTATGTNGDTVYLALRQHDTGRVVCTKSTTLSSGIATATINLNSECNDSDGIYRAKQGTYEVVASSQALQQGVTLASAPFAVMLACSAELREGWLRAIPLEIEHRFTVTATGVTGVTGVSARDVQRGGYPLTWNATARTLSFDNGPANTFGSSGPATNVTFWNETLDQTVVLRVTPGSLPVSDTTGYLMVDFDVIDDAILRNFLQGASAYVEGLVNVPLEPTDAVTPQLRADYPYSEGIFDAPTYKPNKSARRGVRIQLPLRRIIKVQELSGWQGSVKVLTVPSNMIVTDMRNGQVEIVPPLSGTYPAPTILGASGWLGYGMPYGYIRAIIPQFWQFAVTYGVDQLESSNEAMIREGVFRYAAIDALLHAGRGAGGITAGESLSRDGASLSRSFTGGQYGLYSDIIGMHVQWFQQVWQGLHFAIVGKEVTVA